MLSTSNSVEVEVDSVKLMSVEMAMETNPANRAGRSLAPRVHASTSSSSVSRMSRLESGLEVDADCGLKGRVGSGLEVEVDAGRGMRLNATLRVANGRSEREPAIVSSKISLSCVSSTCPPNINVRISTPSPSSSPPTFPPPSPNGSLSPGPRAPRPDAPPLSARPAPDLKLAAYGVSSAGNDQSCISDPSSRTMFDQRSIGVRSKPTERGDAGPVSACGVLDIMGVRARLGVLDVSWGELESSESRRISSRVRSTKAMGEGQVDSSRLGEGNRSFEFRGGLESETSSPRKELDS